jgi:hypothetical protein
MPNYIAHALHRFQNPTTATPEHSPHPWQKPNNGTKTQFAMIPDATNKRRVPEVLGTLLFFARAIDSTL